MVRRIALIAACCLLLSLSVAAKADSRSGAVENPQAKYDHWRKDRCTSIIVAAKASSDGSTMATHTNDCHDCDFRLALIKGGLHEADEKYPVYPVRFQYPRYLGYSRGEVFTPERLTDKQFPWKNAKPVGFLDELPKTWNYIDGSYAIINEWQVGFGESTCSARLVNVPIFEGGKAMFDLSEMTRIALARAKSAREAIQLMGDLGTQYGFYGAEWKGPDMYGEAGEALTVTDPQEAWVFHILADGEGGAVWAAQRVPDEHIAVVANEFIIGEMNLDDKENFMASSNVMDVAKAKGFWDPSQGPFNFRKAYSEPSFHVHREYADRRNWRVMSLVAPSLGLSSDSTLDTLPFSVKPDTLLSPQDIMRIQRDHYEGTEFDLTTNAASLPWGSPLRYDQGYLAGVSFDLLIEGNFERAISIHRTAYSFVTQSRAWLPREVGGLVWFGAAQPHATIYVPFYPSAMYLNQAYSEGSLYKFRRESAWWAFDVVGNYMEKGWMWISQDVKHTQNMYETMLKDSAGPVEAHVKALLEKGKRVEALAKLSDYSDSQARTVVSAMWNLFEHLLAKYKDGSRIDNFNSETFGVTPLFYPLNFLKMAGYWPADYAFALPPAPAPAPKPATAPTTTLAVRSPLPDVPITTSSSTVMVTVVAVLLVFVAGWFVGQQWEKQSDTAPTAYEPIAQTVY